MNEILEGLPKTPLYENFNKYLAALDEKDRESTLDYVRRSHILGNPVLEEFFMREQSAVFQLMVHERAMSQFRELGDNWVASLEPRMHAAASDFFDGMTEFVQEQVDAMNLAAKEMESRYMQAHGRLAEDTKKTVELGKTQLITQAQELRVTLDGHYKGLEATLTANAESERKKVTKGFIEALNSKMDPYIERSFRSGSDKFKAKVILRDVFVVLVGFAIYSGVKDVFF